MRLNLYWRLAHALASLAFEIGVFVVQSWIRPYCIPRARIESLADTCIRRFPLDPIGGTIRQERVARRFGLRVEQGVWRRVRRVIRRRKAQRP